MIGIRFSCPAWRYVLVLATVTATCGAKDEAHPHQGKVTPFVAGDPNIKLDKSALAILAAGKPYKTQLQTGTSGRGLVVQDVQAPTSIVWERILDFNAYNKMVPKTAESKIYNTETISRRTGAQRIWVRMKVGFPMLKLQFFIKHDYEPSKRCLTWTLDYSKKSDLDDSVGFWYVIPHPDNPTGASRVYYSVDVSMFAWVPQFVVDFMSKQALVDATAWVKKYSELEASKLPQPEVEDEAAKAGKEQKKPRGWGFGRANDSKPTEQSASSTSASSSDVAVVTRKQQQIGLTRYALVSTALALSFYNVHLYFSQ